MCNTTVDSIPQAMGWPQQQERKKERLTVWEWSPGTGIPQESRSPCRDTERSRRSSSQLRTGPSNVWGYIAVRRIKNGITKEKLLTSNSSKAQIELNEWMNELNTFIPPNIRLINPISKRFTSNWRFTADELPTWVEQSQDLMLRSTVSCCCSNKAS